MFILLKNKTTIIIHNIGRVKNVQGSKISSPCTFVIFFFTVYCSILVRNTEWDKIKANMPWLLDAVACVLLDLFVSFLTHVLDLCFSFYLRFCWGIYKFPRTSHIWMLHLNGNNNRSYYSTFTTNIFEIEPREIMMATKATLKWAKNKDVWERGWRSQDAKFGYTRLVSGSSVVCNCLALLILNLSFLFGTFGNFWFFENII